MPSNVSGYAGKILRVDLSDGSTSEEELDEVTLRKYIGGTCLGAKYLYDEVPPEVSWADPENRLIIASGPLGGTRVGGSGSFSVITKGSLTNGATSTQANGFLGAFLKFSGFDGIVVHGAAKRWVYLYIHDGTAELRDASHLLGKSTWDTEDIIKEELGKRESEMSVFGIGPAGENLVKFAAIIGDRGHAAGHNGSGAVMGSKKLKAIAVARGKRTVEVHDVEKLSSAARELIEGIKSSPSGSEGYYHGTLNAFGLLSPLGALPVRNYTTSVFADKDKLDQYNAEYIARHYEHKRHSCWACQQHHCHLLKAKDGPYAGQVGEEPEYEQLASWGSLTGPADISEAIMLSWEVDRLGIETNEAGFLIAWVIECYEKGILSKRETDGLEMTWGNAEAIKTMLVKIAKREGFGNVLAEGIMRAAQQVGGEAPNCAIHTMKGNSVRTHDHRAIWFELLDTCVSSAGSMETSFTSSPARLGLGSENSVLQVFTPSDLSRISARIKGSGQFEDSLVVCRFNIRNDINGLCKALNAATGWDFTPEESMKVGRRAVNLLKAFNIRHGIGEELDIPSPRYGSPAVDGPVKGMDILSDWDQIRRDYYEQMGWDRQTSKPLPDTLKRLGLEYVITDIWG